MRVGACTVSRGVATFPCRGANRRPSAAMGIGIARIWGRLGKNTAGFRGYEIRFEFRNRFGTKFNNDYRAVAGIYLPPFQLTRLTEPVHTAQAQESTKPSTRSPDIYGFLSKHSFSRRFFLANVLVMTRTLPLRGRQLDPKLML
jgi:hypothetical protein